MLDVFHPNFQVQYQWICPLLPPTHFCCEKIFTVAWSKCHFFVKFNISFHICIFKIIFFPAYSFVSPNLLNWKRRVLMHVFEYCSLMNDLDFYCIHMYFFFTESLIQLISWCFLGEHSRGSYKIHRKITNKRSGNQISIRILI